MSKKNCVQEKEKSLAGGFYLRQEAVGGEGGYGYVEQYLH